MLPGLRHLRPQAPHLMVLGEVQHQSLLMNPFSFTYSLLNVPGSLPLEIAEWFLVIDPAHPQGTEHIYGALKIPR